MCVRVCGVSVETNHYVRVCGVSVEPNHTHMHIVVGFGLSRAGASWLAGPAEQLAGWLHTLAWRRAGWRG